MVAKAKIDSMMRGEPDVVTAPENGRTRSEKT